MKKIFILAVSSCLLKLQAKAQPQQYIIEGRAGKLNKPAKAILHAYYNNTNFIDSVDLKDGAFRFSGTVPCIQSATLYLDHTGADRFSPNGSVDMLPLVLETGRLTITTSKLIQDATVTGSPETQARLELEKRTAVFSRKFSSTWLNTLSEERYELLCEQIEQGRDKILTAFIKEHNNQLASIEALNRLGRPTPSHSTLQPLYNQLSSKIKNTPDAKKFEETLNSMAATMIGATAPEIALPDSTGRIIRLSELKGKYVLVDFWANWCAPCRAETPFLTKAYATWKHKNFEILGVAFENPGDKERWQKAIAEDKITWPQVCDFSGWENEVAKTYGIKMIPQNVLINPQGIIIAKNLRGDKLLETLKNTIQ